MEGTCNNCQNIISKRGMKRHLQSCLSKIKPNENVNKDHFLINVEYKYSKYFWLILLVDSSVSLESLDGFLRDTWLECCDHLSCFNIDGTNYNSDGDDGYGVNMDAKLKKVINVGTKFFYTYDFGSSTDLNLNVLDIIKGTLNEEKIAILARNILPDVLCKLCEKKISTYACMECLMEEDESVYCTDCKDDHECDEDEMVSIVNSPRFGVCGYIG